MKYVLFALVALSYSIPSFAHTNYEVLGSVAKQLTATKEVKEAREALVKDGYSLHANNILDAGEVNGTERFLAVEVYQKADPKQQDGGNVRHSDEKVLTFVAELNDKKEIKIKTISIPELR